MNDEQLQHELLHLGVDNRSYRALMLLPLLQVAWADGTIQSEEQELVLEIARGHDLLQGAGGKLLLSWLRNKPTETYFLRARRVLLELVHRERGLGEDLTIRDLEELLATCASVARCAGGLFGVAFTMSSSEKAAIKEIMEALAVGPRIELGDNPL